MVGWHHGHNGHEFGWTPGVGDRQRSLAGYSPWDHKESDMTEQLKLFLTDAKIKPLWEELPWWPSG